MSKFKLEPYHIRIQKKQPTDLSLDPVFVPLDNIDDDGADFLTILKDFLEYIDISRITKKSQKTISSDRFDMVGRNIYGVIKSGEYGLAADFVDIETLETQQRARKPEQSEVYPFFFYFYIPNDSERGILIIQTFKIYGIKTIVHKFLNDFMDRKGYKDYTIMIRPLISKDLLKKIEENRVIKIRFIRYNVPKDPADRVSNGNLEELIEEHVFRAKARKKIELAKFIKDQLTNSETRYYEMLDDFYEEIKIEIMENGAKKTLTFGEEEKGKESMSLNISEELLIDGFPPENYLLENAEMYLDYIKNQLGE